MLDSSGSVGYGNFVQIKDFVRTFMQRVPLGTGENDNQVRGVNQPLGIYD